MKSHPPSRQRIGSGLLAILFAVGGLVAPGVHRLSHADHDLDVLSTACGSSCHKQANSGKETPASRDNSDAAHCNLCKISTLGMDVPAFSLLQMPAVPPCAEIRYVPICLDFVIASPPSARGPPA